MPVSTDHAHQVTDDTALSPSDSELLPCIPKHGNNKCVIGGMNVHYIMKQESVDINIYLTNTKKQKHENKLILTQSCSE